MYLYLVLVGSLLSVPRPVVSCACAVSFNHCSHGSCEFKEHEILKMQTS